MNAKKYGAAFANRSLFRQESLTLASLFLASPNWTLVQQQVLSQNLLQSRTISNAERLCRELLSRLKTLHPPELHLLVNGNPLEQGYILWIAVCRRYSLIADFAAVVLRERYISLKTGLRHEEFDAFFNSQAEWNPALERIQPATRSKLRQIMFKILREAELIDTNHKILSAILSQRLIDAICESDPVSLNWFPIFEADLRKRTR